MPCIPRIGPRIRQATKRRQMNPRRAKAMVLGSLLLLALVAGLWLSGRLALWLLGLRDPVQLGTYLGYLRALDLEAVRPHATTIHLAGWAGFGLPLASWLAIAVALFWPRARAFHGNARFATRGDIARAGLLKGCPEGILIGRYRGDYLYLGGTRHVILTAPTRSGKTSSVAIPVLLTYRHSVVCLDLKGELYQATSGYRAATGQAIYRFAPYAEDGRTHRFNPLTAISADPQLRVSELQTLATILYPDEAGKDPFWSLQSRAAFVAFAAYLFEAWEALAAPAGGTTLDDPTGSRAFPTLERIHRFSTGDGGELKAFLKQRREAPFASAATRTALASLVNMAEQTLSSVIASTQAPLQQFLSPTLAAATNATDFDLQQLRHRPSTIYVVIPPHRLGEARKLLNLFFSVVLGENLRQTPQEDPSSRYQLLLLLDEFTAMGRIDVLSARIALTAGYGVRDLAIIQSLSQLDATYGADEARSFLTNHAASVIFTPREQRDAEAYSTALGDTTVKRRSRGTGKGGTTYTHSEERRPLLLPQELKELPGDEEIIFLEGCRPIRCRKNWFFKDRRLRKRLIAAAVLRYPRDRVRSRGHPL
jgi:type IV secretion system protein VirD4